MEYAFRHSILTTDTPRVFAFLLGNQNQNQICPPPSPPIVSEAREKKKKKKGTERKAKLVENEGRNADACAGKSGGNNGKSRRIIAARSVQRGGGSAPFGPNRAGLFDPLPIDGAGSLLPRRGLLGVAAQSSPRHRLRCFPLGRRHLPRCLLLHFLSGLRFNLSLICCFFNWISFLFLVNLGTFCVWMVLATSIMFCDWGVNDRR